MASLVKLFTVLLLIVQAALVKPEVTFQCNDHDIKLSDTKVAGIKACASSAGINSMEEITPDKIPCLAKCFMVKGALIDAEGKPHKENIMGSIDSAVPGEKKEIYKQETEKCLDAHGGNLKPDDPSCLTYAPLAMCIRKAFEKICKG